jgi:hypothetical protein
MSRNQSFFKSKNDYKAQIEKVSRLGEEDPPI